MAHSRAGDDRLKIEQIAEQIYEAFPISSEHRWGVGIGGGWFHLTARQRDKYIELAEKIYATTEVELVKEEVDRLRDFILSSYVSLSAEAYDFFLKIPSYVMRGAMRYAHRRLAEQGRL